MDSDLLALENALFSAITAICAVYLSFMALRHSATPKVKVRLLSPTTVECGTVALFIFELQNVGHWYGKPTAVNFSIFCNFDSEFKLQQIRYGASQSYTDSEPKRGVGNMVYFKAKGLKLTYGEEGEQIQIRAAAPAIEGKYKIRLSGYSENGANLMKEFWVNCRRESNQSSSA